MTEGVGFEPTVGFPTLDFESSALNRTQPPFLQERRKRRTRLRQKLRRRKRRTSNIQPAFASCYGAAGVECNCGTDNPVSVRVWSSAFRRGLWWAPRRPRKRGTPNHGEYAS